MCCRRDGLSALFLLLPQSSLASATTVITCFSKPADSTLCARHHTQTNSSHYVLNNFNSPFIHIREHLLSDCLQKVVREFGKRLCNNLTNYTFEIQRKISKYTSKYRENFCPAIGTTGVISARYQLPSLFSGL